ncbi:hypothetical protein V1478_003026 [Vespula squamosa]|uniref:Uncharacterized protein n=1 Tax=Vespula squamosa TaxID=30214 RepID=A0ABD2BRI3_VESSQ
MLTTGVLTLRQLERECPWLDVHSFTGSHSLPSLNDQHIDGRIDGLADREGGGGGGGVTSSGSCLDREMRIVSVYELSGVGEQIAQTIEERYFSSTFLRLELDMKNPPNFSSLVIHLIIFTRRKCGLLISYSLVLRNYNKALQKNFPNMLNRIHCNYHSQSLKYLVNVRREVPFQNNHCIAIFSAGNTSVFRDKYGIE